MKLQRLPVDLNVKLTDFTETQLQILIYSVCDYKIEKIKTLKRKEEMWETFGSPYPAKAVSEQEIEEITLIETQLYTALGSVVVKDNIADN